MQPHNCAIAEVRHNGRIGHVKAAAATVTATKGASSRLGTALDDVVATLMSGIHQALDARINGWVDELKGALGAPVTPRAGPSLPARAD